MGLPDSKRFTPAERQRIVQHMRMKNMFMTPGEVNNGIFEQIGKLNNLEKGKLLHEQFDEIVKKLGAKQNIDFRTLDGMKKLIDASVMPNLGDDQFQELRAAFQSLQPIQKLIEQYHEATGFSKMTDPKMQALSIFLQHVQNAKNEFNLIAVDIAAKDKDIQIRDMAEDITLNNQKFDNLVNGAIEYGFPLLNATNEQKQKLLSIAQEHINNINPLKDEVDGLQKQMDAIGTREYVEENIERTKKTNDILNLVNQMLEDNKTDNQAQFSEKREQSANRLSTLLQNGISPANEVSLRALIKPIVEATKERLPDNKLHHFKELISNELKGNREKEKEWNTKLDKLIILEKNKNSLKKRLDEIGVVKKKFLDGFSNEMTKIQQKTDELSLEKQRAITDNNDLISQNTRRLNPMVERAKMIKTSLEKSKRMFHSDTKDYTDMYSALDKFIKNPNKESLEELGATAKHYKEEKEKTADKHIISTSMRKHRLMSADELINISANGLKVLASQKTFDEKIKAVNIRFVALDVTGNLDRQKADFAIKDSKFNDFTSLISSGLNRRVKEVKEAWGKEKASMNKQLDALSIQPPEASKSFGVPG